MGEIAARVCARLGVPCDPAAATAQHSYVSAATNSMTDLATADYYEGRIAGLPGGAVLTLSGRERALDRRAEPRVRPRHRSAPHTEGRGRGMQLRPRAGRRAGEREGTPWLLALGPLPSGGETSLRVLTAPEAPLPPVERLLSALGPSSATTARDWP